MLSFSTLLRRIKGTFFGWWIVLSSAVLSSLSHGLLSQGFTVYFLPLQAEFGWSRALLSSGYSLAYLEAGILGPLEGWLVDRFGPRRVVVAGVALLGAGFVLLSAIQSILGFFAAFVVMSIGSSLCGLPPHVAVLNWFVRKRGLAFGIATVGVGLGGLLVPLVAWGVVTHGWRPAALASGVLTWLIGIPMALLLRHKPEKYGWLPDGDRPSDARPRGHVVSRSSPPAVAEADDSFSIQEALKTRAFWLIAAGHASAVLTVSAVSLHLAPHLVQQMSLSLEAAGNVVAIMMVFSMFGRVAGGVLADRINKRALLVCCMLAHTFGLVLLAYAASYFQLLLFAIFHGLAWGVRGTAQNTIRAEYFGRKSIGLILGIGSTLTTVAQVGSPIFAGWLADIRGDYRLALTIIAVLTALGSVFFGFASKPVRKSRALGKATPRP